MILPFLLLVLACFLAKQLNIWWEVSFLRYFNTVQCSPWAEVCVHIFRVGHPGSYLRDPRVNGLWFITRTLWQGYLHTVSKFPAYFSPLRVLWKATGTVVIAYHLARSFFCWSHVYDRLKVGVSAGQFRYCTIEYLQLFGCFWLLLPRVFYTYAKILLSRVTGSLSHFTFRPSCLSAKYPSLICPKQKIPQQSLNFWMNSAMRSLRSGFSTSRM